MISQADTERFWSKARRGEGCWEWQGTIVHGGYGQFGANKETHRAHRLAFQLSVGEIPDGLHVMHSCDNPKCVRPAHLRLGTHADNMADKANKGRASRIGAKKRKMTWADYCEVRRLSATGLSHAKVAVRFGVTKNHVCQIVNGQRGATSPEDHSARCSEAEFKRAEKSSGLTEADIVEIRCMRMFGATIGKLARLKGITRPALENICKHKSWKHARRVPTLAEWTRFVGAA